MKKMIGIILTLVLMLTLVACNGNENTNNTVNESNHNNVVLDNNNTSQENEAGDTTEDETETSTKDDVSFEAIINQMYEDAALELPAMGNIPLDRENLAYMLGVDNFDFIEGLVSEPMMGSFAHSVVMFTVEEGSDIETIKSDIKNNVDGRKWICVGVEDENILVESVGNTIVLIMSESAQALSDAFYAIMN
ncbi:MAG: hypothetical protein JXR88_09280 [Clostridia bacterium]|nr:hypothetical protein [Clostridia bacterium]